MAGELGLAFAANYHVSPATVLEAVAGYRAAFVPSDRLARPYVAVSADVVVGEDDAAAADWPPATGCGCAASAGAKGPSSSPPRSRRPTTSGPTRIGARGRSTENQFVGSPGTVATGLERLQVATGADELVVTTITHDHSDRMRSYELLAKEWLR